MTSSNLEPLQSSVIKVSTCSLNQWALHLPENRDRILEACRKAKADGSSLLITPELSITGYGCLDHFLEDELAEQSWEVLAELLQHADTKDLIVDVGMPVISRQVRWNCRVVIYDGKILFIRPKMDLANDGLFREQRFFTAWPRNNAREDFELPANLRAVTGQDTVPFGSDILYRTRDGVLLGIELCEELWAPRAPSIEMGLAGVHVITNSSGSHHQLRKLDERVSRITNSTKQSGGIYLYSNQRGCDADRALYDGCSMIVLNGNLLLQGAQFDPVDVEVLTATISLKSISSYRGISSRNAQAASATKYHIVQCDAILGVSLQPITEEIRAVYMEPEAEIARGPALWLWDYLRRSNQAGFFLPLSGGIDSCATAVIVASMTRVIYEFATQGNREVIKDLQRICDRGSDWMPSSPQDIAQRMFHTCYMGMEKNSSGETRQRAKDLAAAIGSFHIDMNIDPVVTALRFVIERVLGFSLNYKTDGGRPSENLALQNFQSRSRMVIAYGLAMTLPLKRGRKSSGGLLVLGSANVGEALRGYYTKYDNSSADLNPIGSISKLDLRKFIAWAQKSFEMPVLESFLDATPTAELEPISDTYVQSDEVDMGVTYNELDVFGKLFMAQRQGAYDMWQSLRSKWPQLSPREVMVKVRHFFWYYGINRHKMTTLTPSYHANDYNPDDNRFSLRPFLYPPAVFPWAFRKIESEVEQMEKHTINGSAR